MRSDIHYDKAKIVEVKLKNPDMNGTQIAARLGYSTRIVCLTLKKAGLNMIGNNYRKRTLEW